MCFSAQASFGASLVLLVIGILAIYKNKDTKTRLFAWIPVLFGVQQFCEGVVWIAKTDQAFSLYAQIASYGFLFFAYILWPVFLPLTVYLMETEERKKRCLASFLGIGAVVSSGLLWIMIQNGIVVEVSCNHIAYFIGMPDIFHYWSLFWYFMATIVPFLIVSKKYMRHFGFVITVSAAASLFVYSYYFTSVWCFFAALISTAVYCLI
ncbi:hypothetical protein EBU24_02455 [bacterium]|nr:hypothetical protein [bacterium]